jgi:predicted AlkP superfamily pyrophosphatase or phosphodiesterase
MMSIISSLLISLASAALLSRGGDGDDGWHGDRDKDGTPIFQHVAIFSVDGLHGSDIDKWLAKGPSNISKMLDNGYRYSNAWTTFPSDSFPGTLAQYTGT